MASITGALKREAVTMGWSYIIKNATGEEPNIRRAEKGNYITWKPGQARKMETYLNRAMTEETDYDPDGINVDVDLAPVLFPLAVKKSLGYIVAYTALVFIIGRFSK